MSKQGARPTPASVDRLLAALRPSEEDWAAIKALERSGKHDELARALRALDKKEARMGLEAPEGLDPSLVNATAYRAATQADARARAQTRAASIGPSMLAGLLVGKKIACDCLVPFEFRSLQTFGAMSGPSLTVVRNGILGAYRLTASEYTVVNLGDTEGKGRVPVNGQMWLTFSAVVPEAGRYCLLIPTGNLWVRGHSRVVGRGNSTTSYDAKVWVWYAMLLTAGNTLLETAWAQIHYDGTRSEDRTKWFNYDVYLDPRYVFFQAHAGALISMEFRLEVTTTANEDGIAIGTVDAFGFPANVTSDYDTFAIRG